VAYLMKAKIIVDHLEISPTGILTDAERDQTVVREVWRNGKMEPATFWKLGAIVTQPDCWQLVVGMLAEAADDECAEMSVMTTEQKREAQRARDRLTHSIMPEDFALFDAGMILGYNGDGTYKPGPNFDQMPQIDDDEEDE
jgi:hypothetical protein